MTVGTYTQALPEMLHRDVGSFGDRGSPHHCSAHVVGHAASRFLPPLQHACTTAVGDLSLQYRLILSTAFPPVFPPLHAVRDTPARLLPPVQHACAVAQRVFRFVRILRWIQ